MKPDPSANDVSAVDSATTPLTPGKGLLMLAGTVVMIGFFFGLCHVLGIADLWVAFLFLLYWGMIEKIRFTKLPHCIVGALFGLFMGYLLPTLPQMMGSGGAVIAIGATLLLVYALMMGWLPLAINAMAMIFLTVVTIPAVQAQANYGNWLIALAFGVVYFGGLFALVGFIQQRMSNRSPMAG